MWVGSNDSNTLPSGPIPFLWKLKISCMLITFSSMPVISEMLTTLRVPSLMRDTWTPMRNRGSNLLPHRSFRNIQIAHCHHRFQPGQRVPRGIRVDGCHRSLMPGVHGLQHVESFLAAYLTDDDSVGAHTKAVNQQLPLTNGSHAFDVWRPRLQADDVLLRRAAVRPHLQW